MACAAGGVDGTDFGLYLAIDVAQVTADYSTRYRYTYSYRDRELATELVTATTPTNGFILADKDILWYVDRPGDHDLPVSG